jgi:hypothetical protein
MPKHDIVLALLDLFPAFGAGFCPIYFKLLALNNDWKQKLNFISLAI